MPAREDSGAFEPFPESRWSVLREAARPDRRLETVDCLARSCWKALYTCIRREGFDHEDAKELTQECFIRLGSGDTLGEIHGTSRLAEVEALRRHS